MQIISEIVAAGGSKNAANALIPLAKEVLSNIDVKDPVFQSFATANTAGRLAALSEQLKPDLSDGLRTEALNSQALVNDALNARSVALRSGLSSGDQLLNRGVWAQSLHTKVDQDLRANVDGYSASSNGLAVGVDAKFSEEVTVGVAYSVLRTDIGMDSGNKLDVEGQAVTFYGIWEQGNWFVNGSALLGFNNNDSKRYIAGTMAKAKYDSKNVGASVIGGYTFRPSEGIVIEPSIGARYSVIEIDSLTEKGSSAALHVDGQRYELAELGAGVRMASVIDIGRGTLEPELKLMNWHDFIGDDSRTTSTFVQGDTPFTTTGRVNSRNTVSSGVGLTYKLNAWSVGATYDNSQRDGYRADTVTAKLRYEF